MTFKEYLNQTDPVKMPDVQLTEKDCVSVTFWFGHWIRVILKIHNTYYRYLREIDSLSKVLYVEDQDGNPRSMSCFSLTLDSEKPEKL